MKIAIIGIVGVPGRYGGFETLAENLINYHYKSNRLDQITVWCSARDNLEQPGFYKNAELRYVRLHANGPQSIAYDVISLLQAVFSGHRKIILLGVSGAIILPLLRFFSGVHIITNVDGIEWKRKKWKFFPSLFLRFSEWMAVKFSHDIVADNQAIAYYLMEKYRRKSTVIAYGGDHSVSKIGDSNVLHDLPTSYALGLCRIEPENNVDLILKAWSDLDGPLVFVGNWNASPYGTDLLERYGVNPNFHLLNPVYDPEYLYSVRSRASIYLHGHTAGGTNPSLVEMMHFGIPVIAYDCVFNRFTTENKARYFVTASELAHEVSTLTSSTASAIGADMQEVALRRYTWKLIGDAYFALLESR